MHTYMCYVIHTIVLYKETYPDVEASTYWSSTYMLLVSVLFTDTWINSVVGWGIIFLQGVNG